MRAGPSPSACRSRWQANTIRARSTRLAGSVRERAIETSLAKSSSPIDNSIARRRAVMIFEFRLANQKKQPTGPQRPNESLTKDRFHGIDELVRQNPLPSSPGIEARLLAWIDKRPALIDARIQPPLASVGID